MEDNESKRTNLNPQYWGPSTWRTIHAFTAGFPENPTKDDIKAIVNFFDSLKYLIPCKKCRVHYQKNFDEMPPLPVHSRISLMKWGFELHNIVNKQLGKKEYPYSRFLSEFDIHIDENKNSIENYKNDFSKKKSKINKKSIKICLIILVIILIISVYFFCYLKNDRKK